MVITYEDIKKANDSIKTTDIKGKDYAEVNQRIKAFRMLYPTGTISTEMLSNENGVCIFKATVGFEEDGNICILGTGTAYEKEGSSFINKTSYIENCETSAVGRALGMAGLGIDTSVASAEEVQNAIANQNRTETIDPKWIATIDAECERTGAKRDKVLKAVGINKPEDLTIQKFNAIMKSFENTPDGAYENNSKDN